MPTRTSSNGNETTMSKKKSIFDSFTHRRSQRSLVYNVREAESVSGDSLSNDPIEDKLDKISDDLHSLQNTLRAVAHRVQDLEKVIAEKRFSVQDSEEGSLPTGSSAQQVVHAQVHEHKIATEKSLRRRSKAIKNDIADSTIADIKIISSVISTQPQPQPPPPPRKTLSHSLTKSRRLKYDLDSVIKHELYRTVPKIIVDCCNLIEDHATIAPFDRLYFLSGNSEDTQLVLKSFVAQNNYIKYLDNVSSMHTLANIIKLFFQDLKYPVISMSEIQSFLGTNKARWDSASNGEKVDAMQKLMKSLPELNRDTVKYFIRHLRRLCRDYQKQVRSQELAVSIAPCMFQTFRQKLKTSQENLRDDYLITYLQYMIDNCDTIFKYNKSNTEWGFSEFINVFHRINQRTKFRKTLERCISCPGLFNL